MRMVALGDVAELRSGVGFPERLQGRTSGDYPFAKVGDISRVARSGDVALCAASNYVDQNDLVALKAKPFPAGTIAFAKIGEAISQNFRVIAEVPLLLDNNVMGAIPGDSIDGAYLFEFLRSIDLYRYSQSTTVPSLRKSELARILIPLPTMPEQRRLAAVLNAADALRAKRRRAFARFDTLTQANFTDMFGTPQANEYQFPIVKLGDLVDVKGGKRLPKGSGYAPVPTRYPYIRVTDFTNGVIETGDLRYLTPEIQSRIARYTTSAGDVIISIAGSIGQVASVPSELDGANLTENAAKLVRKGDNALATEYLASVLRSDFAQDQISAKTGQVTIGKLALFRIASLEIMLPPIELQRRYEDTLSALHRLRPSYKAALRQSNSLFASLQQRAFRGEL